MRRVEQVEELLHRTECWRDERTEGQRGGPAGAQESERSVVGERRGRPVHEAQRERVRLEAEPAAAPGARAASETR